jgi:cytidine deaminase
MQKIHFQASIEIIEHFDDLPQKDAQLCQAAIDAKKNAYAIYSKFRVGSAVLMENEHIISGSNQENAVYPLTLCAERVAIFAASHQFPTIPILKIAVATSMQEEANQLPAFPCGSCRQAIREQEVRFETPIEVLVINSNGKVYRMKSVTEILPFSFDKTAL